MCPYRLGSSSKHLRKHSQLVQCDSCDMVGAVTHVHGERLCLEEGNVLQSYSWWVAEVSPGVLNEFVQGEKQFSNLTLPLFWIAWKAWWDVCHCVSLSSDMEGCKERCCLCFGLLEKHEGVSVIALAFEVTWRIAWKDAKSRVAWVLGPWCGWAFGGPTLHPMVALNISAIWFTLKGNKLASKIFCCLSNYN
jgi:hypothetical protein